MTYDGTTELAALILPSFSLACGDDGMGSTGAMTTGGGDTSSTYVASTELNQAVEAMGNNPVIEPHDDFIAYPL